MGGHVLRAESAAAAAVGGRGGRGLRGGRRSGRGAPPRPPTPAAERGYHFTALDRLAAWPKVEIVSSRGPRAVTDLTRPRAVTDMTGDRRRWGEREVPRDRKARSPQRSSDFPARGGALSLPSCPYRLRGGLRLAALQLRARLILQWSHRIGFKPAVSFYVFALMDARLRFHDADACPPSLP